MIKEKTVFVLGAGASHPYGYPTGLELREEICFHFASDITAYFNEQYPSRQRGPATWQAEKFAETFFKSSTKSIDLFLARNPEFMARGKYSILFRIFTAEQKSRFREQMENKTQDWYSYLFERLTEDLVKKDDYSLFCEKEVSFVTFNYDRSLEQFLYESLLNSFDGIGTMKIVEQLNRCRVIHVFGQIAGLDWQDLRSKIEYGRDVNLVDVAQLTKNLRIIYEEEDNPELEESRKLISNARRIFFLGFGYAKENLEILKIPERLSKEQKIYGTALNFTKKEIQDIHSIFPSRSNLEPSYVHIEDLDCLMLLRKYL